MKMLYFSIYSDAYFLSLELFFSLESLRLFHYIFNDMILIIQIGIWQQCVRHCVRHFRNIINKSPAFILEKKIENKYTNRQYSFIW